MTLTEPNNLSLTDMSQAAMEQLALSLGQPLFRGRQLFHWVHGRLESDLSRMANLPRPFRVVLAGRHQVTRAELEREIVSADGMTRKRLLRLDDGQRVEAVLMEAVAPGHEADRYTVCVSSQVGCALGCSFCVTGQVGFARQLSPGEIVEQAYHFERTLRQISRGAGGPDRRFVTNVVFMGMGEPLANYEAVMGAVRLLVSPEGLGLGARRITISTAGIVPGIDRLAGEGLQLGLAISLHAATDEVRDRIMPINRRYPIAQLLQAAARYAAETGRRVTYEYTMMEGVNDTVAQARRLVMLLSGQLCHVNLIPMNRSLDPTLKPSRLDRVATFRKVLEEGHVPCTVRETKGQDILAACGQLRYTEQAKKKLRVLSAPC
ncbi:MAG: 23S rRNA (adenine(2503)-C(2))-methyltransferase RlmN [Chloroflexi bacterium]|nr:23S rRNA (adenine(2503)-C(2))-methyltransferase RlmN [Chloroflexota bacterium]